MKAAGMAVWSVVLYYQTAAETGGNPGWAYSMTGADGQHESGEVDLSDADGGETLSDVAGAFLDGRDGTAVIAGWDAIPDGGWRAKVRAPDGRTAFDREAEAEDARADAEYDRAIDDRLTD